MGFRVRSAALSAAILLLAAAGRGEPVRLVIPCPAVVPAPAPDSPSPLPCRTSDPAELGRAGGPIDLAMSSSIDPDALSSILKASPRLESVILLPSSPVISGTPESERLAFEIKRTTALVRGLRPEARIALALTPGEPSAAWGVAAALLADPTLAAGIDALLVPVSARTSIPRDRLPGAIAVWLESPPSESASSTSVVEALAALAETGASRFFFSDAADPAGVSEIARAQAYFSGDVSAQPSPAGRGEARFFDGKLLTPIVFLDDDGTGQRRLDVATGGPYRNADVQNLSTGARRAFPLDAGARVLTLSVKEGPVAVRLAPRRNEGEVQAQVSVGGARGITAEEIVARERAWQAAQNDLVRSYTAELNTSLRFRVAEVNETFDLTIQGPLFKERGHDFDWAWETFYVNGIKWKGKTLPKIPILQPEKVTTLPLEIELSEDYAYTLAGRGTIDGRAAYEIDFAPKSPGGDKATYKGRAWIDVKTFALLRRRSVQQNLRGETLSNVETEFYRTVPGTTAVLPLEIKGEEVFSTAGRTTAIERSVTLTAVAINPPDFAPRRAAAYASEKQMVRDTARGLKYLIPDPSRAGDRIVEEYVSKKSLFGAAGFFYDGSLSYPIPLLGVQYFNFDLFKKGKQISTFFGGAVLTTNYTDPSFLGSRFDLGADVVGFAIPFGDSSYRNGKEIKQERLKHVPALIQVNTGHPLGPYVKASLGVFAKWDDYQRDKDTAREFVTPKDTFTFGAELKLTANINGFNGVLDYSKFHRNRWEFWGIPGTSEFEPSQQNYEKYSAGISKDYYFSGFRKIHAALTYLSGSNLDRFSRYEFGAFSGNPLRGYQSGALRTREAWVMNLSYGLNIENIIRLEALYDQGIMTDPVSGFRHAYFSGAGISGQLNGPWNNSLIRFDVGVPVVSHGLHGVSASALILKLF